MRIVQAKRVINGRAFVHELDGTAGVGRYIADAQQPVRKSWGAFGYWYPRELGWCK